MKIAVLLASGFEEAEALFTTDIFRRANIKTDLVSINAEKQLLARIILKSLRIVC